MRLPLVSEIWRATGAMRITLRTLFRRSETTQYPHEKTDKAARSRGVIALKEENCTVCMLCARECPVWCIFIEGYKDQGPPRRPGGKPRLAQKLDRFDIDYSLCMYCGICVEVCPFDALFWSPEYEYSEAHISDLLHDKDRLGQWMHSVGEEPPLEPHPIEPDAAEPDSTEPSAKPEPLR